MKIFSNRVTFDRFGDFRIVLKGGRGIGTIGVGVGGRTFSQNVSSPTLGVNVLEGFLRKRMTD